MLSEHDDAHEHHEEASGSPEREAFDHYYGEGLVTELISPIKSGKEANVWVCRANEPPAGSGLLALKVYRSRDQRSFANDHRYKAGRVLTRSRDRNAVRKKTAYGRAFEQAWWTEHEWEVLRALHAAGGDVPCPVARTEQSLLMSYIGDEEAPAPQLRHVELERSEARTLFERLLWNVELFLANNWVHADLSAFNVLWWAGRVTVIDFPQAVDPRSNPHAAELLTRDLKNLCDHFARLGVRRDWEALSRGLWTAFTFAEL